MTRFWLLAVLAVVTISPARGGPTVCNATSYIGDQIPGSLNLPLSLSEDGKTYPILAKSVVTEGYSRNILCFQYQLVNAGTEGIPVAYWNLVDDYRPMDLVAQDSRSRNRSRPTTFDDAVKAPTKVKGLRAAETPATAWQTVEDANNKSKKGDATKVPTFSFAKASSLDGAVADAVKSGLLPDEEVAVFDRKAAQGTAPVSDSMDLAIGSVRSISGVDFKDRATASTQLRVLVAPQATRPGATRIGEVRIFSPFLSAMGKEPRETAQFLDSISRSVKEPVPILTTADDSGVLIKSPGFDFSRTFYVVEHPLTIEWLARDSNGVAKSSVQCIRIASYSPFPVSLNERFCVR